VRHSVPPLLSHECIGVADLTEMAISFAPDLHEGLSAKGIIVPSEVPDLFVPDLFVPDLFVPG